MKYPLVVAIDETSCDESLLSLASRASELAFGLKVGVPTLISCGLRFLRDLRAKAGDAFIIADLKLADVGDVMVKTASLVRDSVNAVIAHSFVGKAGALDRLAEAVKAWGLKLILVASMSHPGSLEFYDAATERVVGLVRELDPWGIVAPATRPHVVRSLRSLLPSVKILAPGVGAQGASPGDAICVGADYEIVGRAILGSPDPLRALADYGEAALRCLKLRG